MDRASRHLRLLSETIATVSASLDVEEVTSTVARAVARALEADACFVYLLDEGSGDLVLRALYGTSLAADARRPRMRPGEGLTGHAALDKAPVAVAADAANDPRFLGFPGLDEERFASLLAVPIVDRRERLQGAMNVRTVTARPWQDDEVELLETIATQVAQAIENATLYEHAQRRVAELEALARISAAVSSSLYEQETLAEIVATAAEALAADCCALVIGVGDGATVAHRAGAADPSDARLVALAAAGEPDPRIAVAPLRWKARDLGALVAVRREPFDETTTSLLDSIAHHAATAVEAGRGALQGLVAQEIHHRVKNNLQTVASLLRLRLDSSDPVRALDHSVERVLAIAEVHDLLTASRAGDVEASALLTRVAETLGRGLGTADATAMFDPLVLPGESATSLALVFSELYANALEHGGGVVSVQLLARPGEQARLSVRDRGRGLPARFDPDASLGLRIARALTAESLGGTLELRDASPGVDAVVSWTP